MLAVMLSASCNGSATGWSTTTSPTRLTRSFPLDFTLPTTAGQRLTLSSLRGKVLVLNFFTIGCLRCQALFDRLLRVQAAFGAHRVAIVGVALDRQPVLVRMFAQSLTVPFPILVAGSTTIPANREIKIRVVPLTLILDRKGRVQYAFQTVPTTRQLAAAVKSLLK